MAELQPPPPRIGLSGDLVSIRPFEDEDAPEMLDLRMNNLDFFRPYEPSSIVVPKTLPAQLERFTAERKEWDEGRGYVFGIFRRDDGGLAGRIAFSHVARGAWQNAVLGYFVDADQNGKGFATEAAGLALRFAFGHAGLHRVQAGVMPRNERSIRVLTKAGFRNEGVALRYLDIGGAWEDHIIFAITREEWTDTPGASRGSRR
jgi:ribosomal-protein-alanine N-acetyltransferase